jgi:uncharacterized protein YjeT (DUF2065 family)
VVRQRKNNQFRLATSIRYGTMGTLVEVVALVMILEGILPMIAPNQWAKMMQSISLLSSNNIRLFGVILVVIGILILQFI